MPSSDHNKTVFGTTAVHLPDEPADGGEIHSSVHLLRTVHFIARPLLYIVPTVRILEQLLQVSPVSRTFNAVWFATNNRVSEECSRRDFDSRHCMT